jgi:hypothetical protein
MKYNGLLYGLSWPLFVLGGVFGALLGFNLSVHLTREDPEAADSSSILSRAFKINTKTLKSGEKAGLTAAARRLVYFVCVTLGFVLGTWPAYMMHYHIQAVERWEDEIQDTFHLTRATTLVVASIIIVVYYLTMLFSVIYTFGAAINSRKKTYGKINRKLKRTEREDKAEKERLLALLKPEKHHKAIAEYEKSLKRDAKRKEKVEEERKALLASASYKKKGSKLA